MRFDLYSARWQSHVTALSDEIFGEGYITNPSELSSSEGAVLIIGHEGDDELICFALGSVLPADGLRTHLEGHLVDVTADIAKADRNGALGVVQAVAVSPANRRSGYGTKLIGLMHDKLVGMGADTLIVSFKRRPNVPHVDGMMGKLGFRVLQRLPSFWRERCDTGEFHCADRRNVCTCEALLYCKTIF